MDLIIKVDFTIKKVKLKENFVKEVKVYNSFKASQIKIIVVVKVKVYVIIIVAMILTGEALISSHRNLFRV